MDERAVAQLAADHDVLYDPVLVDDMPRLMTEAQRAEVLIVRNRTQVRNALLSALGRCKVVGRLGVGLDNIDVAGCEARRMRVIPASGANALSVAEYVLASAMMLLRAAYASTPAVAAGLWPRVPLSEGRETAGQTLGIIGFGVIGQTTARLAQALGMKVVAFDAMLARDAPAFAQAGVQAVGLNELVANADVVTLHVPLVDTTRGLFNAARIATMKPGAILINTSRGHIVDLAAVAVALRAGRLGGAAIDVFDVEPLQPSAMLQDCPRLLLTPHVSGLSRQANERVSFMIADKILESLK
ncbi:MAG: NAD(P)-binding domain-containing protein [Polaromonas sp.]|uniref:NAD(P)-dependent oxidoreductase n=1 Tax=Polaromonas sp. TaxID=1869339 RepID=UPI00182F82C0|nr:NAD(P)-dependent oxidoreductase [Polaromonas sp.]MBA3593339.1 NAD(P)-binding domain-containing protein [Polaromonas sp.]